MISIIVPIFNSDQYLARCIDSILAQTFKDIEVLLIDDGSTDTSLEIANMYKKLDRRIVVFSKENGGQVSAWKLGVEESKGQYIGFVDSDDWIENTMYEKLYKPFNDYDIQISACSTRKIYSTKCVYENVDASEYNGYHFGNKLKEEKKDFFNSKYVKYFKFYRCNKLFKKDLFVNNISYIDNAVRIFEDNCIVIPCMLDAVSIFFVDEHLYNYVQRENSTMRSFSINTIISNRIVVDTLDRIFSERNIYFNKNSEIVNMCLFSIANILQSSLTAYEKNNLLESVYADVKNIDIKTIINFLPFKHRFAISLLKKHKIKKITYYYEILCKFKKNKLNE